VVGSLIRGELLLEDVIDALFFRPLDMPSWSIDLTPLAVLEGFENAVTKGSLEGYISTSLSWEVLIGGIIFSWHHAPHFLGHSNFKYSFSK